MISVILDKVFPSDIKSPKIYLGNNFCIPSSFNTVNLSCTFEILNPGIFKPLVNTEIGNLINQNTISDVTVNMIIVSVDPITVRILFYSKFIKYFIFNLITKFF